MCTSCDQHVMSHDVICTHLSCSGGGVDGDLALSIAIRVDNCVHVSSTLRREEEEEEEGERRMENNANP